MIKSNENWEEFNEIMKLHLHETGVVRDYPLGFDYIDKPLKSFIHQNFIPKENWVKEKTLKQTYKQGREDMKKHLLEIIEKIDVSGGGSGRRIKEQLKTLLKERIE